MTIAKKDLLSLREMEATFLVELTDCLRQHLGTEELYINGQSTAQLSSMQKEDFETFYGALGDSVRAYAYIDETTYLSELQICALFVGGSMTGAKVWGDQFKIK